METLRCLDVLQNECLGMCLGALRCTRVAHMEVETYVLPLSTVYTMWHTTAGLWSLYTTEDFPWCNFSHHHKTAPQFTWFESAAPRSVSVPPLPAKRGCNRKRPTSSCYQSSPQGRVPVPPSLPTGSRDIKLLLARRRYIRPSSQTSLHLSISTQTSPKRVTVWVRVYGRVNAPSDSDCLLIHQYFRCHRFCTNINY